MTPSALIFDTETTGLHEPQLIEAAWLRVASLTPLTTDEQFEQRYQPAKRIDLGAMAVNHITDEELEGMPAHDTFRLPAGTTHLIGHNVDFDWRVIGQPDVKRIDTKSLCSMLWPDTDSHRQMAMLYLLDRPFAREHGRNAHSALADVRMLERLLQHILAALPAVATLDDLWAVSEQARIPRNMPFGKHKGELIQDVPVDYCKWLLRQEDVDPYLRKALETVVA